MQQLINFLLVIASIQPTHAYVLISIYLPSMAILKLSLLQHQWHVVCSRSACSSLFFFFPRQFVTFLQGPERVKRLYAFRSLIDSGARITLGSDFPVESINPLSAFYAAVTRKSPDGKSPHGPGGWYLSLCVALTFISLGNYTGSQNNDWHV